MTPSTKPTRTPILGCIADDVTGATDLATNLVQAGMCVVQLLDVPSYAELALIDADAIVIALKTRSIAADDAISISLEALTALRELGIARFFFKYCSTFDSTNQGNIGPVAKALLEKLEAKQTVFCPAFPKNGRTVYHGHLFVHGLLLNESGMESHPINPMTDANLLRVLSEQLPSDNKVGLLGFDDIESGEAAKKLTNLAATGKRFIITDACNDRQLRTLADCLANMALVTGGSGIARYLPDSYRSVGLLQTDSYVAMPPDVGGRSLIVSGSCSKATQAQVAFMHAKCESRAIDVEALLRDANGIAEAVVEFGGWIASIAEDKTAMIYSTSSPERVSELQSKFGAMEVATTIENCLASITEHLVEQAGVRRLVLAGGETSGAIVKKLGIRSLRIGPEICPGVPWTQSVDERPLALAFALKSGNFGEVNFFEAALEMLS